MPPNYRAFITHIMEWIQGIKGTVRDFVKLFFSLHQIYGTDPLIPEDNSSQMPHLQVQPDFPVAIVNSLAVLELSSFKNTSSCQSLHTHLYIISEMLHNSCITIRSFRVVIIWNMGIEEVNPKRTVNAQNHKLTKFNSERTRTSCADYVNMRRPP